MRRLHPTRHRRCGGRASDYRVLFACTPARRSRRIATIVEPTTTDNRLRRRPCSPDHHDGSTVAPNDRSPSACCRRHRPRRLTTVAPLSRPRRGRGFGHPGHRGERTGLRRHRGDPFGVAVLGGTWREVSAHGRPTLGRNGFAPPGKRREGDGRTPSGSYGFGFFFGVDANPGVSVSVPPGDRRPTSSGTTTRRALSTTSGWTTARQRPVPIPSPWTTCPLYDYGAVIDYNTDPGGAGAGSAIFFHVSTGGPTAGMCVVAGGRAARRPAVDAARAATAASSWGPQPPSSADTGPAPVGRPSAYDRPLRGSTGPGTVGDSDFWAVVRRQRACLSFLPDPVDDALIASRCSKRPRFAPSAENRQPWVFVVVRSPEQRAVSSATLTQRAWQGGRAPALRGTAGRPGLLADVDGGALGGVAGAPGARGGRGPTPGSGDRRVLAASIFPAIAEHAPRPPRRPGSAPPSRPFLWSSAPSWRRSWSSPRRCSPWPSSPSVGPHGHCRRLAASRCRTRSTPRHTVRRGRPARGSEERSTCKSIATRSRSTERLARCGRCSGPGFRCREHDGVSIEILHPGDEVGEGSDPPLHLPCAPLPVVGGHGVSPGNG